MTMADRLSLAALKERTARAHVRAEKSGIVADLLRRRADRDAFVLFLRNLAPAYAMLEDALATAPAPAGTIRFAEVERSAALAADLSGLSGNGWRDLPIMPAAEAYAARIREVGARNPELLIAHAYVRYFGDLNGGQILRRMIGETLALPAEALGFYDFPDIVDMPAFQAEFRAAYECALGAVRDPESVLAEAEAAFEFNISVSEETQAFSRAAPAA